MATTRTRTACAAALAAFALAGCSSVWVDFDANPDIDFAGYKTFWQTPPPKSTDHEIAGYTTIVGNHIQVAIAHELENKGLIAVGREHADLIVAFSIDGQPRRDLEWTGGWEGWYGGNTYLVDYADGTLTIDLFDAARSRLVWHAYGRSSLYGGSSRKRDLVDEVVEEILEDYPPPRR